MNKQPTVSQVPPGQFQPAFAQASPGQPIATPQGQQYYVQPGQQAQPVQAGQQVQPVLSGQPQNQDRPGATAPVTTAYWKSALDAERLVEFVSIVHLHLIISDNLH